MSSCHVNIVYSAGANDLKAVCGLLHGSVTLLRTFLEILQQMLQQLPPLCYKSIESALISESLEKQFV